MKSKGPGASFAPGPRHFNKEQTPLAILRYQPADSRRLFRCLGAHLLGSPYNVKAGQTFLARVAAPVGQSPSVESHRSPAPVLVLCRWTSSRRRFFIGHSSFTFRCRIHITFGQIKTKNPAYTKQAGFRKLLSLRYLLPSTISKFISGCCPRYGLDNQRPNAQPWLSRL